MRSCVVAFVETAAVLISGMYSPLMDVMTEPTWSQALERAYQEQGGEEAIENALSQRSRCQSALLDAGYRLEEARKRHDLRQVKKESEDVVFWGNEEKGWEGFIGALRSLVLTCTHCALALQIIYTVVVSHTLHLRELMGSRSLRSCGDYNQVNGLQPRKSLIL